MNNHTTPLHCIPIFQDNYVWVIFDKQQQQVVVVDPGDAGPVLDFLEKNKLKLAAILITHHHSDHTQGLLELIEKHPVPVYGPHNPTISGITHPVKEGDRFTIPCLDSPFTVLETPGHTLDHIAYVYSDLVFCGDTLFSAGCGRLFEGTADQMLNSLHKLTALPDETLVCCTHEYTLQNLKFAETAEPNNPKIQDKIKQVIALRAKDLPSLPSCIGDEKEFNPFLRCHIPEVIARVEKQAGLKTNDALDVFKHLRLWKNNF